MSFLISYLLSLSCVSLPDFTWCNKKSYFVAFILFILITKSGSCFPGFFLPFWMILQTIFVYAYIPFVALGILEV